MCGLPDGFEDGCFLGGEGGGGKKRYWYSKVLNLAILCVPGQYNDR